MNAGNRIVCGLLAGAIACAPAMAADDPDAVHESLLTLDTHLDTPANLDRPEWDIAARHDYPTDFTSVDLPRMVEGGLDGGWWVIFTPQRELTPAGYEGALAHALKRAGHIHRILAEHPGDFALALKSEDAARIAGEGKRIVYISMENSYPLGTDLGLMEAFYALGMRMAGPVHGATNQFADSATGDAVHGGLSDLGRQWVAEANRLGIVIDGSHASDSTFDDLLELSKAPIVLSHSGPRALYDHPRNLDDARLKALAAKGGVVQINSLYLDPRPEPSEAAKAVMAKLGDGATLSAEERADLYAELAEIEAGEPYFGSSFDRFMESVFYTIDLIGVDHVGMGADWDGGGGVNGMEDVSMLPKITAALLARGYSRDDVEKIWSGNVLRVMAEAERVAAQMAAN